MAQIETMFEECRRREKATEQKKMPWLVQMQVCHRSVTCDYGIRYGLGCHGKVDVCVGSEIYACAPLSKEADISTAYIEGKV